jgi:outer membrane protein OmpA-like peptidoglycan-associated protein
MNKKGKIVLAGLSSLLAGAIGITPSWAADSKSGYFLDHQKTVEGGGVGNYTNPQGENVYNTSEQKPLASDTGRFLDHDQTIAMGGVGNYVTRGEAKAYDQKLAEQERMRNQLAGEKAKQPVASVSPDEGVVFFGFDQAMLKPDAKEQISSIADELKKDPSLVAEVNGYTDSIGNKSYNEELSNKRADAVKGELLNQGVKPDQIRAYGFGEKEPIASNDTNQGRAVNRRAELYIENKTEATG